MHILFPSMTVGNIPKSGIAGSWNVYILHFVSYHQIIFQNLCITLPFHQQGMRVIVSSKLWPILSSTKLLNCCQSDRKRVSSKFQVLTTDALMALRRNTATGILCVSSHSVRCSFRGACSTYFLFSFPSY